MHEEVNIRTRSVMSRSEMGKGRCPLGGSRRDALLFLLPPSVLFPLHLLWARGEMCTRQWKRPRLWWLFLSHGRSSPLFLDLTVPRLFLKRT